MSDYKRVTFREPVQVLGDARSIVSDDKVTLRKATDPRRVGEGVEVLRDGVVEFISIELVSSITFAPVQGTAVVAGPPVVEGPALAKVAK